MRLIGPGWFSFPFRLAVAGEVIMKLRCSWINTAKLGLRPSVKPQPHRRNSNNTLWSLSQSTGKAMEISIRWQETQTQISDELDRFGKKGLSVRDERWRRPFSTNYKGCECTERDPWVLGKIPLPTECPAWGSTETGCSQGERGSNRNGDWHSPQTRLCFVKPFPFFFFSFYGTKEEAVFPPGHLKWQRACCPDSSGMSTDVIVHADKALLEPVLTRDYVLPRQNWGVVNVVTRLLESEISWIYGDTAVVH